MGGGRLEDVMAHAPLQPGAGLEASPMGALMPPHQGLQLKALLQPEGLSGLCQGSKCKGYFCINNNRDNLLGSHNVLGMSHSLNQ